MIRIQRADRKRRKRGLGGTQSHSKSDLPCSVIIKTCCGGGIEAV